MNVQNVLPPVVDAQAVVDAQVRVLYHPSPQRALAHVSDQRGHEAEADPERGREADVAEDVVHAEVGDGVGAERASAFLELLEDDVGYEEAAEEEECVDRRGRVGQRREGPFSEELRGSGRNSTIDNCTQIWPSLNFKGKLLKSQGSFFPN